jgi:hypothetical protein
MNERIQELAEQANLLGPSSRIGNSHEAAEKFAELIVRECIERVCSQYTPIRDSTIEGRPNPFFPELRVRTECEQAVIESGIKSIMALEELIQESTDRWYKENILGDEA